jgi:hypothetical protein
MAKFFIPMSLAISAAVLWCMVVVLALRPFGFRLRFGVRGLKHSSVLVRWTAYQYVVLGGVVILGCGVALAMTVNDYVCWRLWPSEYLPLTLRYVLIRWVVCALFGAVIASILRRHFLIRWILK